MELEIKSSKLIKGSGNLREKIIIDRVTLPILTKSSSLPNAVSITLSYS